MRGRGQALILLGLLALVGGVPYEAFAPYHTQPPEPQEQVVRVSLEEWTLGFQEVRVQPGGIRFEVENDGAIPHAFKIGWQVEDRTYSVSTALLQPGDSAVLILELPAGHYDVWCPVAGHRDLGMEGVVIVEAQAEEK